jgi:Trk K+ transport system NAD-binding subunit
MNPHVRRLRANLHYLRRPVLQFLPVLGVAALIVIIGGLCFLFFYREQKIGFIEAFFVTFTIIFGEHEYAYPQHPLLQILYWVLPVVGLAVVVDAIVRFSTHFIRRDENQQDWIRAMSKTYSNHVVLCGLGKVGVRVLSELLEMGEEVVVMEKDPQCPNIAFARKRNVPVVIGTGREEGILDDLNVAHAKSIICGTDDDLVNLEIALDARKINPGIRVVMRMFDQELAAKVRDAFDIHLCFSTSAIAAPLFATSSADGTIINAFHVGEKLLAVAEIPITPHSELIGQSVGHLRQAQHIYVVAHRRGGATNYYPESHVELAAGDVVTLQTEPQTLKTVHVLNKDRERGS